MIIDISEKNTTYDLPDHRHRHLNSMENIPQPTTHVIDTVGMKVSDLKERMRVRYVPSHAKGDVYHKDCEDGTVSSWNSSNVFVKFDKQLARMGWSGTTAQSCYPKDLIPLIK